MKSEYQKEISYATADAPCPHCGKPDWCYRLGDLTVCNREHEPASGWVKTTKTDKEGKFYCAPIADKPKSKKDDRSWEYQDREGKAIARYRRIDYDFPKKPKKWQESWDGKRWVSGFKGINRADIPVYRYQEIRQAIADGETLYIVAGEKCADVMWSIGLPATTNICGEGHWQESDTECLEGAREIVICPDNDRQGIKHAYKLLEQFPNSKFLYAPPSNFYWVTEEIPLSKGLDVADFIAAGADKELVKQQISSLNPGKFSASLPLATEPEPTELVEKSREVIIEAEEIYTQKAVDCLYSGDSYIAIHDKLYRYMGSHYEVCSTPREKRRVLEWCKSTPIESHGKWKYSLAKPETVNKIWTWVLTSFAVDPEEVNPPGINCLNGVLQISWKGRKVSYELVPHNPEFYFTHVGEFEYNPEADDRDCNRLLAALDTEQQNIFLRTMAASLDLPTVRKYQGRTVKALICTGTGSNGKDTLREAVKSILGSGMSSASVTDFQQYDQGRKFPAAKIEQAKINWSSENSEFARIDSLQGLKAAITGEDFDIEPKNAPEYPITPRTVFLFNCNSTPLLQGGSEAIASRWSVLSFNKTFKTNANVALGELQADSRFRYDPDFLNNNVCPALLNKILAQLQQVVLEGIDYSCCDRDLIKVQEQSNHLWSFINDVGIQRSPGSRLYISDLWRSLEKWYVENGTLEYERIGDRLKKIWHDQARKSDRNITASNQVGKRFRELFPDVEIKRHTERDDSDRMGKAYISGLAIAAEASAEAETTAYQSAEDAEAKMATLVRLVGEIKLLPSPERLTAIKIMNDFVQSETELGDLASASSAAHYERDFCLSTASAEEKERSPKRSPELSNPIQTNSGVNNKAESSVVPTVLAISQSVTMPITNTPTTHNHKHKPIDWIRDKAGQIWMVEEQNNDFITAHRSGLRGSSNIRYEDVAEYHYKKETEEVES